MKKQTGITLIALIITIIVMLILVGVTINVALNGGLFDKAKTASEQTQREADKEQLLSAVIATVDNNGDFHLDQIKLPDGFEVVSTGVYKNKETEKEYTVDTKTGKVTEVTSSNSGNSANKDSEEGIYSFVLSDLFSNSENYEFCDEPLESGIKIRLDTFESLIQEDIENIVDEYVFDTPMGKMIDFTFSKPEIVEGPIYTQIDSMSGETFRSRYTITLVLDIENNYLYFQIFDIIEDDRIGNQDNLSTFISAIDNTTKGIATLRKGNEAMELMGM